MLWVLIRIASVSSIQQHSELLSQFVNQTSDVRCKISRSHDNDVVENHVNTITSSNAATLRVQHACCRKGDIDAIVICYRKIDLLINHFG